MALRYHEHDSPIARQNIQGISFAQRYMECVTRRKAYLLLVVRKNRTPLHLPDDLAAGLQPGRALPACTTEQSRALDTNGIHSGDAALNDVPCEIDIIGDVDLEVGKNSVALTQKEVGRHWIHLFHTVAYLEGGGKISVEQLCVRR